MAGVQMPELPPATAGVGRGQRLRDRDQDQESPSCTQHLLPRRLEAAVGGVVAKGKVWEGSERDQREVSQITRNLQNPLCHQA